MTTYDTITDGEIASGKPVTSSLIFRLRDNVLAIQEGDASAPKISWAAFTLIPGLSGYIKDTAGSDTLLIPAGITKVRYRVVGGGGGAAFRNDGVGNQDYVSGNGAEMRHGLLTVTPGETLSLVVGAGGVGVVHATNPLNAGADSTIYRGGTQLVRAKCGSATEGGYGGAGGNGAGGKSGNSFRAVSEGGNTIWGISYGFSSFINRTTASGYCPGGFIPTSNTDKHPGCGGPKHVTASDIASLTGFDGLIIIDY